MSGVLSSLSSAVIEGDVDGVVSLTRQALEGGFTAEDVLNRGLMAGMNHVGIEFRAGQMFVPEVLRSARTMQASMDLLKPLLAETGGSMMGTVLLGTVKGDLHDIGKNLVAMMCEGAGFEVKDLGKDVSPEAFVAAVHEYNPDVLGISALLTTTMPAMQRTIEALESAGIRDKVKVMVGGAPVTQNYADHIGADGYASNAPGAADLAKRLADLAQ